MSSMPPSKWTPEVLKQLRLRAEKDLKEHPPRSHEEAPPAEKLPDVTRRAFRLAAVRSRFRVESLADDEREADLLRESCVRVASTPDLWTLRLDVRNRVLGQLEEEELRNLVLSATDEDDPIRNAISAALSGLDPRKLQERRPAELSALKLCYDGLAPRIRSLPPRHRIEQGLELSRLLDPLRKITATFMGREPELQKLRDYVGVLQPGSRFEQATRAIASVFTSERKAPLLLVGTGGVGKTTLVARFILEHAHVEQQRFPFAYVDLNRPAVRPDEPLTIFLESVRQIGLQYDNDAYSAADHLCTRWEKTLRAGLQSASWTDAFVADFSDFLGTLQVREGPVLLVIDTFEELQMRSAAYARNVFDLAFRLTEHVRRLRVVIAGRADMPEATFAAKIALAGLDQPLATSWLSKQGVDSETAGQIFHLLGGSPLALTLAADLYHTRRDELESLRMTRLKRDVIEAHLFDRVLLHIADVDVRNLAKPGLVLRRVTPDIIRQVLAEPCGVSVPDERRAEELFQELSRQVPLVSTTEPGVVVPRTDTRQFMLQALRESSPGTVDEIHRRAVDYYSARSDVISRAEEIYHRLALRQPRSEVAPRMLSGVEACLANAVDELAPPEQAVLAELLGLELPPEAARVADQETWERSTSKRVNECMATGDLERADAILKERSERSAQTDLRVIEVRFLNRAGRYEEATRCARDGAVAYDRHGNHAQLVAILVAGAMGHIELRDFDAARDCLLRAEEMTPENDWLTRTRIHYERLLLMSRDHGRADNPKATRAMLRTVAEKVSEVDWALDLGLLRDVAGELAVDYPPIVTTAIRLGALELRTSDERDLRLLLKIRPEQSVDDALLALLAENVVPTRVLGPLSTIIRRVRPQQQETSAPAKRRIRRRVKLDDDQRARLCSLLANVYNAAELEAFYETRFRRGIEAITFSREVEERAAAIVVAAEREGTLDSLVVALIRSNFDNQDVLTLADNLGFGPVLISSRTTDPRGLERFFVGNRGRLGALESRICTIERAGSVLGCGVLIGPDLLLTHRDVVVVDPPATLVSRFDRASWQGQVVAEGREVTFYPAQDRFDFGIALLKLEGRVGAESIDFTRAAALTRDRGFVDPGSRPWSPAPPDLFWLWRDESRSFITHVRPDNPVVQLDGHVDLGTEAEPKARGTIVMDAQMNVVGVHCGGSLIMPMGTIAGLLGNANGA